jgi:hypothetical protein
MSSDIESIDKFNAQVRKIKNIERPISLSENEELKEEVYDLLRDRYWLHYPHTIASNIENSIESDETLEEKLKNVEIKIQRLEKKMADVMATQSSMYEAIKTFSSIKEKVDKLERRNLELDSKENVDFLLKTFDIEMEENDFADPLSRMQGMFNKYADDESDSVQLLDEIREDK